MWIEKNDTCWSQNGSRKRSLTAQIDTEEMISEDEANNRLLLYCFGNFTCYKRYLYLTQKFTNLFNITVCFLSTVCIIQNWAEFFIAISTRRCTLFISMQTKPGVDTNRHITTCFLRSLMSIAFLCKAENSLLASRLLWCSYVIVVRRMVRLVLTIILNQWNSGMF